MATVAIRDCVDQETPESNQVLVGSRIRQGHWRDRETKFGDCLLVLAPLAGASDHSPTGSQGQQRGCEAHAYCQHDYDSLFHASAPHDPTIARGLDSVSEPPAAQLVTAIAAQKQGVLPRM